MNGERLAHFELQEKIGEGGMGAVYRARDSKLGREVAIKLLPEAFSADADRLARLEREARALASLHHPNIAAIFGLEEAAGRRFLVMELVPGEDLSTRIRRSPLTLDEVMAVTRQIAEGLEDAHQKGIVHRDLKPANVKVTPDDRVKILDFGLAQAYQDEPAAASDPSLSPTVPAGLTAAGVILGTAAYMSPEQARGKPVDRRTDIWSFGCVLYECLTGRAAFQGGTVSDLMASILRTEPDLGLLPEGTPPRLRELLARCLRKDAKNRLREIGDARIILEELAGRIPPPPEVATAESAARSAEPSRRRFRLFWPWAAGAFALGVIAAAALLRSFGSGRPMEPPLRLVMAVRDLDRSNFAFAPKISQDGRLVAYKSRGTLWIRSLERFEDRAVPGSDGADGVFWSPDGASIGFSKDRRLWIWSLNSTENRMVCALPGSGELNGAVWMADGAIYFCLYAGGFYAVLANGGEPELVLEPTAEELDFHLPAPLPGGKEFVAAAHRHKGKQQAFVFSCEERRRYPVLEMDELSAAVYSPAGYMLLTRNWTTEDVWAVRYSVASRKAEGAPFPAEFGAQYPSVTESGAMVFYQGDRESLFDLLWISRDGSWEAVPGGPFQGLADPAVSPDGRRIAYSGVKDDNRDIWVLDLERGTRTRLTSGGSNDFIPRWSADGRTVFYRVWIPGKDELWRVPADGTSGPRFVTVASTMAPLPGDRSIVISAERGERRDGDLYLLSLDEGAEPVPLVQTDFDEEYPAVSPNGRWLAYSSVESGEPEIYVRRLPEGGQKQQASVGGGGNPMWGTRGEALYYWQGDALMEVAVKEGEFLELRRPRRIFTASDLGVQVDDQYSLIGFGMSPDGQRFLVGRRSADDPRAGILYVQGWQPPVH